MLNVILHGCNGKMGKGHRRGNHTEDKREHRPAIRGDGARSQGKARDHGRPDGR